MEKILNQTLLLSDLSIIADEHHLTPTEKQFFVDLISSCFPLCHYSYAVTWANRIQKHSEYHCASGNVKFFMDRSYDYAAVKKERKQKIC